MKFSFMNIAASDKKSFIYSVICSIALAVIYFAGIYGFKILNPFYTDWILNRHTDINLHYLGFCFFRTEPFVFPPGLFSGLSYPENTSIMNTDSISIFAIFFKFFSGILNKNFQYIGLFVLSNFIMSSVLGMIICRRFCKPAIGGNIAAVLAGFLFCLMPSVLLSSFWHTSSTAHWLILLTLIPLVYYDKLSPKNKTLIFLLFGILSVGINAYVTACGIIITFIYFLYGFYKKDYKHSLQVISITIFAAFIMFYLIGGFSANAEVTGIHLNTDSFNLNGYINSFDYSPILPSLPAFPEQIIGFAYFGAGALLFIFAGIFCISKKVIKEENFLLLCLLFLIIISIILALSPRATIGQTVLYELNLPDFIKSIWSMLRCTGRFIWISNYVILILAVLFLAKKTSSKMLIILTFICICIQIYDLQVLIKEKHEKFNNSIVYQNEYENGILKNYIKQKNIKVINLSPYFIYLMESRYEYTHILFNIGELAYKHNVKLNNFYFARRIKNEELLYREKLTNPKRNELYIFLPNEPDLYKVNSSHKFDCTEDEELIYCTLKTKKSCKYSNRNYLQRMFIIFFIKSV